MFLIFNPCVFAQTNVKMSEASDKTDEVPEKKTEDDLPQHILEKYDSDHQVQLIKGYRYIYFR